MYLNRFQNIATLDNDFHVFILPNVYQNWQLCIVTKMLKRYILNKRDVLSNDVTFLLYKENVVCIEFPLCEKILNNITLYQRKWTYLFGGINDA